MCTKARNINPMTTLDPPIHIPVPPLWSYAPELSQDSMNAILNVNDGELRVNKDKYILVLLTDGQNSRRISEIRKEVSAHDPRIASMLKFLPISTRKANQCTKRKGNTKATFEPTMSHKDYIRKQISPYLRNTTLIVISNFDILQCILSEKSPTGNIKTLTPYRGSTYVTEYLFGIPAFVLDDVFKTYASSYYNPTSISSDFETSKEQAIELFRFDCMNIVSLYKDPTKSTDNFDANFRILGVNPSDRAEFRTWLSKQVVCALDFEVSLGETTCLGITASTDGTMDNASTYLLPVVNPTRPKNNHGAPISYLNLVKEILHHPMPKFWHNMSFDLAQAMRMNMFLDMPAHAGPNHDTMLMWNALYAKLPQSLATLSSCVVPSSYYWKQEIKGSPKDKANKLTKYAVPPTGLGLYAYWRYCGRDCWNTLAAAIAITPAISSNPAPKAMYERMRAFAVGPLMETNMAGVRLDRVRYNSLLANYRRETVTHKHNLSKASAGLLTEHTPLKAAHWLYDILGAEPTQKGRSTDAKVLSLVSNQSPLLDKAVTLLQAYREPQKQLSSFENTKLLQHRYPTSYSQSPYTGRLNSSSSNFFMGGNLQNITYPMRGFVLPEQDHILLEVDYSAADSYHTAAASGDTNMRKVVFDPTIDTHLYNISIFLDKPYSELAEAKANNEPWLMAHDGMRKGFKPVGHGCNYMMQAKTCAIQVGKQSIHEAAILMGHNPIAWTQEHRNAFVVTMMDKYFKTFPELIPFRKIAYDRLVSNSGHVTCFGGNSCYFPTWNVPSEKTDVTRKLLAYYGQGGTSGMVNRATYSLYFDEFRKGRSMLQYYSSKIIMQTHDSLTFSIPYSHAVNSNVIKNILDLMTIPCYFNDIEFTVPVEANIGFRWGKELQELPCNPTHKDITLACLGTLSTM